MRNHLEDENKYKKAKAASPWDSSSLISKYFLSFMLPLIKKGMKGKLKLEDVWNVPEVDRSEILGKKLERNFYLETKNYGNEASFVRAVWKTFRSQLILICLADFFGKCIAAPMQAIALGWIIRDASSYYNLTTYNVEAQTNRLEEIREIHWRIAHDAIILVLMTFLASILSHPLLFQTNHIGMKIRVASSYMIYKKSLRLSKTALSETTAGQMVNLLSNDVNRFDLVVQCLPYIVIAPIQSVIALTILAIYYLGLYATLASSMVVVGFLFIQTCAGKGFSSFRAKTARRTDERVRLINEIILAMRIIKMYVWEEPFQKLVDAARNREMNTIGLGAALKAVNQSLYFLSSKILVSAALITFIILGYSLLPAVVFVTSIMANSIRMSLTLFFPNAVAQTAEALVSCKRINHFLQLPEIETINYSRIAYKSPQDILSNGCTILLNHVWCSWMNPETISKLDINNSLEDGYTYSCAIVRDLSISLKAKDLLLIVGRVGSGKSSVLMAILGELPLVSGRLEINGKISYASQKAWIFGGTVRDNILLDNPYQPDRYAEVIRVCSLERDLEILVDGDATFVGERGVSLSGGQRARVNLARALYAEADIYLLDDPLSAVDAPVAKYIFNESLRTFLRKKTVILATHQLQFLRYASKVLVVDRDLPASFGTLQEVMDSDTFKQVDYSKEAFKEAKSISDSELVGPESKEFLKMPNERQFSSSDILNDSSGAKIINGTSKVAVKKSSINRPEESETLDTIPVKLSTYIYYLRNAASIYNIITFIFINILCQTVFVTIDIILSLWSASVERRRVQGENFIDRNILDRLGNNQLIILYTSLILTCTVISLIRSVMFYAACYRASLKIHRRLFNSIIHGPMTFFDFSPVGILLNRFSRDIGFVDEIVPAVAIDIIVIFANVVSILIVVIVIDYANIIAAILLIVSAIYLKNLTGSTIRKLKQMEGVTRSPIFSHLSTTLAGLTTIRASCVQDRFMLDFNHYQDTHSSIWFSYVCTGRWLTVCMDWISTTFIALVVLVSTAFSLDSINPSSLGLLISQVIVLPATFQWGIRQLVELESQMTSVERIKEFSELKPEEPEEKLSQVHFKVIYGEIKFINVSLPYFANEPPVLKNISFAVKPGEKVGIVGRTGAGKTSLISILFRLYDFQGSVKIDNFDTRDLSLAQLRRKISIIPQDPILFGGTIRRNLDPFEEHSDEQIWSALEAVQLKQMFIHHPNALNFIIQEGGSNFSVGQRQLICLARAIVRRNQILVLDEATANVDPETDMFIQRTISEQFAHCTVLTIAHRLITIAKADRVLVLDRGEVKEFAAPSELIDDKTSLFSQMVEEYNGQTGRLKKNIQLK